MDELRQVSLVFERIVVAVVEESDIWFGGKLEVLGVAVSVESHRLFLPRELADNADVVDQVQDDGLELERLEPCDRRQRLRERLELLPKLGF